MSRSRSGSRVRRLGLLAVVCLALAGCGAASQIDSSVHVSTTEVLPVTAGSARFVPPRTLADAMMRAGFDRAEILKHGPAIAAALQTSGGAQVRSGKTVEALLAVHEDRLIIASRSSGTFMIAIEPST
jgi:hypothetical protein